jgi:hypothetical protein
VGVSIRVQLDFIRPGRPVENGYIESFNSRMRDECLNVHVFFTLVNVSEKFELWRESYNQVRPHGALEDRSPQAFTASWNRKSAVTRNAAPAKNAPARAVHCTSALDPKPERPFGLPSAAVKGGAEKLLIDDALGTGATSVLLKVLT